MIAFMNDEDAFARPLRPVLRRAAPDEIPGGRPLAELGQAEKAILSAFIASLLLPGSGHMMRGHYFIGLLFLAGAVFVWLPPVNVIWPIVAVHLAAAFNILGYGRR